MSVLKTIGAGVLAGALMASLLWWERPEDPPVERYVTGHVTIIDGDTWKVDGVTYRHVNIDAPERDMARAECPEEVYKAGLAVTALKAAFEYGGARTYSTGKTGKYGRTLALLPMEDGREAEQVLIDIGLARYLGSPRNPWCKRTIQ